MSGQTEERLSLASPIAQLPEDLQALLVHILCLGRIAILEIGSRQIGISCGHAVTVILSALGIKTLVVA